MQPLMFLCNAFLGVALVLFGNKFSLVLILVQTFRVTALPIIQSNWNYIVETYTKVSKIILEERENVQKNLLEL